MQIKTKRALSASTIASLLITSSVVSVNVKAASVTPPESPRLWGADRYETAVKVSQAGWTSGSDYAVIASGEGYADALCAAPLAKVNNAPILLTQKGELNQNTLKELKRLNVKHVFIIGGQGVVSQAVEDAIKANVTSDIQRLWGQNRYETSVKVAEKLGTSSKIVLASGEGYADALSAAPVAAIEGMPILLTESKTLSKATADYIKANAGITKTYVIGGYASVSDAAMNMAPVAQRFGGSDRYETNTAVINGFSADFNFSNAYVALGNGPTGNEFADALAGSALAAKNKNPLIITGVELSESTKNLIKSKLTTSSNLTILGGTSNVSDSLVNEIKEARGKSTSGGGGSSSSSGTKYLNNSTQNLGTISSDAYVTVSGVTLANGEIKGTLYIDAGDGDVTLDSVTADNVVVKSAGDHSIHFKGNTNIKGKLRVEDPNGVRIVTEGTTQIAQTEVSSQAILESTAGSFGDIKITDTSTDKTIELRGTFNKPIVVEGQATLTTTPGAVVPKVELAPTSSSKKIKLAGIFALVDVTKPASIEVTGKVIGIAISSLVHDSIQLTGSGTVKNIENNSETAALNIGKDVTGVENVSAVNKDTIASENTDIKDKTISIVKNDDLNYLSVNSDSPILSYSLSGAVSYDIYRNGIRIQQAITNKVYQDANFEDGDNEYYVVGLDNQGKAVKRTVTVKKNYHKENNLDSYINMLVSFAKVYGTESGKFTINGTVGNWSVDVDDNYKNTSVSDFYVMVLNKIKTRPLTQNELDTLNSLMDSVEINDLSLNEYLITKLTPKSHSKTAIEFLQDPSMDNLNKLRTALANYDSYSELVGVLNEMSLIHGDKLIPTPTVKGMKLTEILFNNTNSETNAKVLTTGQKYSGSDIKTKYLGLASVANSEITYNDLIAAPYGHVGFKFTDAAGREKIYWISASSQN